MRALVATGEPTAPAGLAEVDPPAPAPHEAVVAVRAVSLNRGEVRNLSVAARGWRPGWDLAGEVVEAAADGSGPQVGTRVVGLVRQGAWAERVAVGADWLAVLPDEVAYTDAATLPVAGLTALRALRLADRLVDSRVLVTGAAGGVGRFALQLASEWGARCTAVVGSADRGGGLAELGAAVVVGMPERGAYDLILESVGGASLAAALDLVAPRGTIVTYGVSSRESTTFDAGPFFRKGGTRLVGLLLFEELDHHCSAHLDLAQLVELLARGAVVPHVDLEVSWHDARAACEALLARRVRGKAVLRLEG